MQNSFENDSDLVSDNSDAVKEHSEQPNLFNVKNEKIVSDILTRNDS